MVSPFKRALLGLLETVYGLYAVIVFLVGLVSEQIAALRFEGRQ